MQKLGFYMEIGKKGSKSEHIETQTFKKQTLEKEIDFLEKDLTSKKDELTGYSERVESDLIVPVRRQMKNIEVPTGEKAMFGLGKEITKTERKTNENGINLRKEYKKM